MGEGKGEDGGPQEAGLEEGEIQTAPVCTLTPHLRPRIPESLNAKAIQGGVNGSRSWSPPPPASLVPGGHDGSERPGLGSGPSSQVLTFQNS